MHIYLSFWCYSMASLNPTTLIMLGIGIAVLVAVIPSSIEQVSVVDTANWSAASQSLWNLLPLIIVAVIVVGIAGMMARRKGLI